MSFADLVGQWPKLCETCETPWSESEWMQLPLVSASPLEPGVRVERRRCRCGDVVGTAVGVRSTRPR